MARTFADEVSESLVGTRKRDLASLQSIPRLRSADLPDGAEHRSARVTIVIPVHGKWPLTAQCLHALEVTEAYRNSTTIIVDDASPDDTVESLGAFDWVKVRSLTTNVGFPKACNAGASGVDTEYLLFLNNDTQPQVGFVDALVRLADTDPRIAIVGSRLVYPDGLLQEAGGIIWEDGTGENYGRNQSPDDPAYLHVRDVDYCSAASVLVRTAFFRAVGGFDERYSRGYYEDTDLAFSARSMGLRVVYQPESVVVHLEGGSHGTDVRTGVKAFQEINRSVFVSKWATTLREHLMPGVVPHRYAASNPRRQAVLIVEYAIPTPNRDSGSRRTQELITILQGLGYDLVLGAEHGDPWGADASALRQQGVMVLFGRGQITRFIDDEGDWLALAIIARAPVAKVWQPKMARRSPNVPVVFDTVDLHHLRELGHATRTGSPADVRSALATKETELAISRASAATIVVSKHEAEYLREMLPGTRVFIVSNVHRPVDGAAPFSQRRGLVFVGSFLHNPNVDGMAWFITEVWPLLPNCLRDDGLEIVGQNPPAELVAGAPPNVHFRGWVPDVAATLARARLSIAPLRFGAGVKGKVGEAWSHGVPVVGTALAMAGMVEPSSPAYLVGDQPADLASRITEVYRDEARWRAASHAARSAVEARFSAATAADALSSLLAEVARQPPHRPA